MNNEEEKFTRLDQIIDSQAKNKINEIDDLRIRLDETRKEMKDTQTSVIEALALFAAFFTFVTVNVQIFTRVTDLYYASWYVVLLLGALGFFAILVDVIIRKDDKLSIFLSFIFMFFIACALYVVKDVELNNTENQGSIRMENQGSSVKIKDNNMPIGM